jgi:hypothetical protein
MDSETIVDVTGIDQPPTTAPARTDEWGKVEIFGHRKHYGRIAEVTKYGVAMLQIDVPTATGDVFERHVYTPSAIFGLTLLTEEEARAGANRMRSPPYVPYRRPVYDALPDLSTEDKEEIGAANESDLGDVIASDGPLSLADVIGAFLDPDQEKLEF